MRPSSLPISNLAYRFLAALILTTALPLSRAWAAPAIHSVQLNQSDVPRFGKIELTVDLSASFQNPVDRDDVSVEATFADPRGSSYYVNGF